MPKSSFPPTFRAARGLVPTFPDAPRAGRTDLPRADDFRDDADDDRPAATAAAPRVVGVRRLDVDDFDFEDADFDFDFDEPERFAVVFRADPERDEEDDDDLPLDFFVDFLPDLPADLPPDLRDAIEDSFVRDADPRRLR